MFNKIRSELRMGFPFFNSTMILCEVHKLKCMLVRVVQWDWN